MRLVFAAFLLLACSREKPTVKAESPVTAATPRVVASGQVQPWNLSVDATRVFWANKGRTRKGDGSIASAPKSGGASSLVAEHLSSPFGLALANKTVFFACAVSADPPEAGRVLGEDPCIGDVDHLERATGEPWALAVDEETLFWTDLMAKEVVAGPLTDVGEHPHFAGTRTVVAKTEGRPVGLAIDATHVYWTVDVPGTIARVHKAGGAVETLAHGDKPVSIAVDATHVYWCEWGSGRIAKVPKSGGETVMLASDQKGARGIAVDDARVYFGHPASGSIRSVAKAGGDLRTHATAQKHPYAIAIDATTIYWADVDAGTVMAVTK